MTPKADERVNVVLVFADDLGAWAMGCAGNDEIHTPVLDALAGSGIRFENFFCTSPVCSPARASMLTGRMPSQTGVHDWIRQGNYGSGRIDFIDGYRTLHGTLAESGYDCALVGKWHLGASDAPRPEFSHWFVHEKGGGDYFGATMYRGSTQETVKGYLTDAIADDAIEFITARTANSAPFFLNVSFTAPHHPWVDSHPQELVDLYEASDFAALPNEAPHKDLLIANPETADALADPHGSRVGYYAAVTGLDRALGRILDALENSHLDSNTLVAFVGDNGFNLGHHGIWGKGNGTFPFNMFDTSVAVPAIFRHSSRIPAGLVRTELVSGYDLCPTILEYLGIDWCPGLALPGSSFAHLLQEQVVAERGAQNDRPVVVFDEYGPVRMIRTSTHKYVHRYPDGPHEFFDLCADPDERENLIDVAGLRDMVEGYRRQLDQWFASYALAEFDGESLPVTGLGQDNRVANEDAFAAAPHHGSRGMASVPKPKGK